MDNCKAIECINIVITVAQVQQLSHCQSNSIEDLTQVYCALSKLGLKMFSTSYAASKFSVGVKKTILFRDRILEPVIGTLYLTIHQNQFTSDRVK